MKILVIANSNNIWVRSFIEHVISEEDEVYLLNNAIIKKEYIEFYKKRNVTLVGTESKLYKIPKVGALLRKKNYCKKIKDIGSFDRCIILNTTNYRLSIWNNVKNNIEKTAILYWGSDIHRVPVKQLLMQKKYLDYVDSIIFIAQNLKNSFMSIHSSNFESKIRVIQFGLDSLNYIDEVRENYSKNQIKRELGLPLDKTIIAIGYCGIPEQQHEKVINEIMKMDVARKDNICIMLQFMYNTKEEYKNHIISIIKKAGLDYVVFEKFLESTELAKLRYATDIFINAQTTDALAGSMLESVYAGAKLVNAKWLDYPELEEWKIKMYIFESFEDLKNKLNEAIDSKCANTEESLQKLKEGKNWDTCKKNWDFFWGK